MNHYLPSRLFTRTIINLNLKLLISLLIGIINVFSFAPFYLWPLQIITLTWLLSQIIIYNNSLKHITLISLVYGFGWSGSSVHWIYISMHNYGGMTSWMALIATIILSCYLSLYVVLATIVSILLQRHWLNSITITLLLVLPALWTLSEWARGFILTGFPWITSGYAHTIGPLAGYAPIFGVYGLTWVSTLIAGFLTLLHLHPNYKIFSITFIILLILIGIILKTINWTHPTGQQISVRLLQGNISQKIKFSNKKLLSALIKYDQMIHSMPADLIVIPETAIPILPMQLPPKYLTHLAHFAQNSRSYLIIGIPLMINSNEYTNSVLGFATNLKNIQQHYRYDKHHLVPFGEFIPHGFNWFINFMKIPLGNMTNGKFLQVPFIVQNQWIMPNICYEDLFGEEIAAQLKTAYAANQPQANILLNLSNVAWFNNSIALPQHLQISQMRALETGRPILRVTNTGITAVINAKGQLVTALIPYTSTILATTIQGYQGQTPYILFGNKFILIITLTMLIIAYMVHCKN